MVTCESCFRFRQSIEMNESHVCDILERNYIGVEEGDEMLDMYRTIINTVRSSIFNALKYNGLFTEEFISIDSDPDISSEFDENLIIMTDNIIKSWIAQPKIEHWCDCWVKVYSL